MAARHMTTSQLSENSLRAKRDWIEGLRKQGEEGRLRALALSLPQPPSFHDAIRCSGQSLALLVDVDSSKLPGVNVGDLAEQAWTEHKVNALSVHADESGKRGSYTDIVAAMQRSPLPILCRDLILDPLQVIMARAHGAAAIVLRPSLLNERALHALYRQAHTLRMDVVAEVTSVADIDLVRRVRLGPTDTSSPRIYLIRFNGARETLRLFSLVPDFVIKILELTPEQHGKGDKHGNMEFDAALIPVESDRDLSQVLSPWRVEGPETLT